MVCKCQYAHGAPIIHPPPTHPRTPTPTRSKMARLTPNKTHTSAKKANARHPLNALPPPDELHGVPEPLSFTLATMWHVYFEHDWLVLANSTNESDQERQVSITIQRMRT